MLMEMDSLEAQTNQPWEKKSVSTAAKHDREGARLFRHVFVEFDGGADAPDG